MKTLISLKREITTYFFLFLLLIFASSCEDDFTNLGSDYINSLELPEPYVVQNLAAYSDNIRSVQSNSLNNYLLGEFADDIFGDTKVSILSQLELGSTNPDFGADPVLDSVVLTIPFYSSLTSEENIYTLDSIFGEGVFKIGVYESNQFLSDFEPDNDNPFQNRQSYYSDQFAEFEPNILLSNPLTMIEVGGELVTSPFSQEFNPAELTEAVVLIDRTDTIDPAEEDEEAELEFARNILSPRLRIKLNPSFFKEKILDNQNSINLVSQNSFKNFLRGLYITLEPVSDDFMMSFLLENLNPNSSLPDADITLYYRSLRPPPSLEVVENPELEITFNEFTLNFSGNKINFYEDDNALDLSGQDTNSGEETLFLKGGEGVVTIIDPFNGDDLDNNGVADEIDMLRANNWLVNEANLIMYVNKELSESIDIQPFRVFVYDLDRERVLIDYNLDGSTFKTTHLGPLQEDDDGNSFYKIRMTSHINNIINNDSTNTRIGVVVTQNVNDARILEVRDSDLGIIESAIESSISTPRGTVLHGNLSSDEELRLKLQIFYTKPN